MPYDTSITKRKGCSSCISGKELSGVSNLSVWINGDCNGLPELVVRPAEWLIGSAHIKINYCPICGKGLKA